MQAHIKEAIKKAEEAMGLIENAVILKDLCDKYQQPIIDRLQKVRMELHEIHVEALELFAKLETQGIGADDDSHSDTRHGITDQSEEATYYTRHAPPILPMANVRCPHRQQETQWCPSAIAGVTRERV